MKTHGRKREDRTRLRDLPIAKEKRAGARGKVHVGHTQAPDVGNIRGGSVGDLEPKRRHVARRANKKPGASSSERVSVAQKGWKKRTDSRECAKCGASEDLPKRSSL